MNSGFWFSSGKKPARKEYVVKAVTKTIRPKASIDCFRRVAIATAGCEKPMPFLRWIVWALF
jgi:hypothetical protein